MSNNFKILIVAVLIFALGVAGAFFLHNKSLPVQDRRSQLSNVKPLGIATDGQKEILSKRNGYWSTEHSEKPVWMEKPPQEKSSKETVFDKKLNSFLDKEFTLIPNENSKGLNSKMVQAKSLWISNYINNNEVWYKSDYKDELSDSKFTIFFNFYKCSTLKCFKVFLFNFRNDNWYSSNMIGREANIRWRNNTAYIDFSLDYVGDFTRHTGAWYLLMPLPRDSMPVYYVRYEDNKFGLSKGPDSDWILVSEKEFKKFEAWTHAYKVKHGEMPDH